MKILIDKTFQKDWKKIKDKDLNQKLIEIIEKGQLANQLSELPQLKKLSGSNHFYRIRLGDFRLGVGRGGFDFCPDITSKRDLPVFPLIP